jgi:hypothetical protein
MKFIINIFVPEVGGKALMEVLEENHTNKQFKLLTPATARWMMDTKTIRIG